MENWKGQVQLLASLWCFLKSIKMGMNEMFFVNMHRLLYNIYTENMLWFEQFPLQNSCQHFIGTVAIHRGNQGHEDSAISKEEISTLRAF